MTDRISSFQSSPATTFYLEADATADASYGDSGRWRIRFYLRAKNGPGGTSGSSYNGSGNQIAVSNASEVGRHSGNPFLPSGYSDNQTRWKDGPWDDYRVANADGYWQGTSTSMPCSMRLTYGSIDTQPGGSVPLPRIARAPGAPGAPVVSAISSTSATITWTAAARGNANITKYQYAIYSDAACTQLVIAPTLGNVLTDNTADNVTLTPGVPYWVRVRATNADGTGVWSSVTQFMTLAGVFVSDGVAWKVAEVYMSDGSTWKPALVQISDGTTWKPAG